MSLDVHQKCIAINKINGEYVSGFGIVHHGRYSQYVDKTTTNKEDSRNFFLSEFDLLRMVDYERIILELLHTNKISNITNYLYDYQTNLYEAKKSQAAHVDDLKHMIKEWFYSKDIETFKRSKTFTTNPNADKRFGISGMELIPIEESLDPVLFKLEYPDELVFENVNFFEINDAIKKLRGRTR